MPRSPPGVAGLALIRGKRGGAYMHSSEPGAGRTTPAKTPPAWVPQAMLAPYRRRRALADRDELPAILMPACVERVVLDARMEPFYRYVQLDESLCTCLLEFLEERAKVPAYTERKQIAEFRAKQLKHISELAQELAAAIDELGRNTVAQNPWFAPKSLSMLFDSIELLNAASIVEPKLPDDAPQKYWPGYRYFVEPNLPGRTNIHRRKFVPPPTVQLQTMAVHAKIAAADGATISVRPTTFPVPSTRVDSNTHSAELDFVRELWAFAQNSLFGRALRPLFDGKKQNALADALAALAATVVAPPDVNDPDAHSGLADNIKRRVLSEVAADKRQSEASSPHRHTFPHSSRTTRLL